jgi:hypothetical protein
MPSPSAHRPEPGEYAEYYARYVSLTSGEDICSILEGQSGELSTLLTPLTASQAGHRYAPGKWSIGEVVGHLSDTERVMAYRALRIARGDSTPLPGFDENLFVERSGHGERPLADLLAELAAVRASTVTLFRGLPEEAWGRRGQANGKEVSVRAIAYIIAGHELHHRRILEERYLGFAPPGPGA